MSKIYYGSNKPYKQKVCATCGQIFFTTTATPFKRTQVKDEEGHKRTCYYCSESCKRDSYERIGCYDTAEAARRRKAYLKEYYAKRAAEKPPRPPKEPKKPIDWSERNKRYYAENAERIKAQKKAWYQLNSEEAKKRSAYQRQKRKLIAQSA